MIAELGRLQGNTQLRSTYNDMWHQWLPKITKAIKINATPTSIKRLKEIDVGTDLEDEDGKTFTMYITKQQIWHCFTAGRLTLKLWPLY